MRSDLWGARTGIVGRDAVLGNLFGSLARTAEGEGTCVVVEGPAGIGKTCLLDAARAEARRTGVDVAAGCASELDRAAPLTTLLMTLQDLALVEVEGDLGQNSPNRLLTIARVRAMIEGHVRDRPLLVVIDDAHWVDELSALALRILVPALASAPVCWLLARRPVTTRSPAQDAVDWLVEQGAQRLLLDPLGDDSVRELCARIVGAPVDQAALALAGRCGGNPLLLQQVFATLVERGDVRIVDGVATVGDDPSLPSDFLGAVAQRLQGLTQAGRRLLEVASVLGRAFTIHEAAGMAGCAAASLFPAAAEAVEAGLLVDRGSELGFRHDLLREAVYRSLPTHVRIALHREAATVVEDEGGSLLEVAEHLVRSDRQGDTRTIDILTKAVDEVAPTSPATAAELQLRLLNLMQENSPQRRPAIANAVKLLAAAGRITEARELGEDAVRAGLEQDSEVELVLGLAEALKHAGHNEETVRLTRRVLERDDITDEFRAHLLAVQAHGLLFTEEFRSAAEAGTQGAALAHRLGHHAAGVHAMIAVSMSARIAGDLDEALHQAQQAVELADAVGGEASHRHPRLWLAAALTSADRFTEAATVYETGQRESDVLGTGWAQPLWHYYRAELWEASGALVDAGAEAEAGLKVAEQLSALALAVPLLSTLARMALHANDLSGARAHLARAAALLDSGVTVGPEDYVWTLGLVEEAAGAEEEAFEHMRMVVDHLPERRLLLVQHPHAAAMLVETALRHGARKEAQTVVEVARVLHERNPTIVTLEAASIHADGLLCNDLDALRTAMQSYEGSPRPLSAARAIEDTALAEAAHGDRERGIDLLNTALRRYESSGADRGAARVHKALRGLGVRRKRRVADNGVVPGGLTESEWRVVQLVIDGLTNREVADRLFLSPHTVDSHLRHSFTKLDVKSRVELTRVVLELSATRDHEKA